MLLFHDVLPVDQPVRPLAVDYRHGDSEPDHYHNCAQLIHSLSGVVQVTTRLGSWVVPPSRGVWVPAKMVHSLRITGRGSRDAVRRSVGARRSAGPMPGGAGFTAAARVDYLCDGDCARLSERRAR